MSLPYNLNRSTVDVDVGPQANNAFQRTMRAPLRTKESAQIIRGKNEDQILPR